MVSSIMSDKKSVDEKLSEALDTEFESEAKQIETKRKVTQIQVNANDSEKDYWLVRRPLTPLPLHQADQPRRLATP